MMTPFACMRTHLKINCQHFGDKHPEIATIYNNIGDIYSDQGKYDDAIGMHEISLKIRLSAFGDNHPSIADNGRNLRKVMIIKISMMTLFASLRNRSKLSCCHLVIIIQILHKCITNNLGNVYFH